MHPTEFARLVDISALQTTNTVQDIRLLIDTARRYRFLCVFALSSYIPTLIEQLKEEDIAVGAPIGFPSGADMTEMKALQALKLLEMGCDEFDMVMHIGWLKSKQYAKAERDIREVRRVLCGKPLKVIVESPYLTKQELVEACHIVMNSGADYIKTGTGWAPLPTTLEHVDIIANTVQGRLKIKAAGGIRDLDTVFRMREMGVSRFGISVKTGVALMEELESRMEGDVYE